MGNTLTIYSYTYDIIIYYTQVHSRANILQTLCVLYTQRFFEKFKLLVSARMSRYNIYMVAIHDNKYF